MTDYRPVDNDHLYTGVLCPHCEVREVDILNVSRGTSEGIKKRHAIRCGHCKRGYNVTLNLEFRVTK